MMCVGNPDGMKFTIDICGITANIWEIQMGQFTLISWVDGYHFIVLNTEWDIKDRAYISPEQLKWLDKTMAENADPSKPILSHFIRR